MSTKGLVGLQIKAQEMPGKVALSGFISRDNFVKRITQMKRLELSCLPTHNNKVNVTFRSVTHYNKTRRCYFILRNDLLLFGICYRLPLFINSIMNYKQTYSVTKNT